MFSGVCFTHSLTFFDVALSFFWGKAQTVFLAQPEGLGKVGWVKERAKGLTVNLFADRCWLANDRAFSPK